MDAIKKFEHNGKTVKIYQDPDPEHSDPRDCENLGIMLANGHRHYTLGDEGKLSDSTEYDAAAAALKHFAEHRKIGLFPRWCRMFLGSTVVLPLGLIDHSGISMYVGGGAHWCDPGGWDSGLIGFIFDTAKTRETCGTALEDIEEGLRAEVKEYDQVLTGDVYGYVITDKHGEREDSCWGFVGYEYALQSARDAAGYTCKHCQRSLSRWVGPVIDEKPEGSQGFVHTVCSTCHGDVDYQEGTWWHISPEDVLSLPHEPFPLTHRHACRDGAHTAETDQTVKEYA